MAIPCQCWPLGACLSPKIGMSITGDRGVQTHELIEKGCLTVTTFSRFYPSSASLWGSFPFQSITSHLHFYSPPSPTCAAIYPCIILYNTWSPRLWLIYAYPLPSPLSYTIFKLITVVAGPSQAFHVFNLSYVRLSSLRLDLLYQYQAIASEVPRDQYTTDSSTCEPLILGPIDWLHQFHSVMLDAMTLSLEMWQTGLTKVEYKLRSYCTCYGSKGLCRW